MSDALADTLRRSFPLWLGVKVAASREQGQVRLDWEGDAQGARRFACLLVAAGRPPALDGLDPGKAGLACDERGVPCFDPETMRCGQSAVFIAGDANHDRPLLHEAQAEGAIAGRNAAAFPDVRPGPRKVAMAVTFTRPEAATVGTLPGPDDADHVTGEASHADQGRATVEGRGEGLVRIFARGDGRLTGAALCAPGGEHLAHLLAWAIEARMTAAEVLDCPFYHPTLEEGLRGALRDICRAAGTPTSRGEEDGPVPGERCD